MKSLYEHGRMFYDGMQRNQRKAHCKVCGDPLEAGEGERWMKFGPRNDFHFQTNYLCPECTAFWAYWDPASRFEYLELYGHDESEMLELALRYAERFGLQSEGQGND